MQQRWSVENNMSIPTEILQSAWETFTDEYLSQNELVALSAEVTDHTDLLAKILLETDFLEKYPEVERVLKGKAPRVMRCLTEESPAALNKTLKMQRQELQRQLFEKQQQYTKQLSSLVSLEHEIIYMRQVLSSYK